MAVRLVVRASTTHTEAVLAAIGEAGGGQVGRTADYCAFIVRGEGWFRPLEELHSAVGSRNQIERGIEDRLKVTVTHNCRQPVIAAVRCVYPNEIPVLDLYPLLGPEDTL